MRTMTVLFTLFILIGVVNSPASAGFKVKDFDGFRDVEIFKVYINGVGQGYGWANAELEGRNQKLLYCQPRKLALTEDNFLRILDDEIKERRKEGQKIEDSFVELMLLLGLQRTFPCKK